MSGVFRFSFGPWNISSGADPFGPEVRESIPFNKKLKSYKKLGYGAVQFHDDDAVPELDKMSAAKIKKEAAAGAGRLHLDLVENPDIVSTVAALPNPPVVVGFAAETEDALAHARAKLERKGLDAIVVNDVSRTDIGFGTQQNAATHPVRQRVRPGEYDGPENADRR